MNYQELISDIDSQALGSESQNLSIKHKQTIHKHVFEVTLNLPRTKSFNCASSDEQKRMYRVIWTKILSKQFNINDVQTNVFVYEHCKNGSIHLHGYIKILTKYEYHITGMLGDLVKRYLRCIRQCYKENRMYVDYQRYKDASIVMQYREDTPEGRKRFEDFQEYMKKEINIAN